jgi:hypothetical protein
MELHRLKAVCIYIRRKALIQGRTQKIVFSRDHRSYEHDRVVKLTQGVSFTIHHEVKGPPGDPREKLNKRLHSN